MLLKSCGGDIHNLLSITLVTYPEQAKWNHIGSTSFHGNDGGQMRPAISPHR